MRFVGAFLLLGDSIARSRQHVPKKDWRHNQRILNFQLAEFSSLNSTTQFNQLNQAKAEQMTHNHFVCIIQFDPPFSNCSNTLLLIIIMISDNLLAPLSIVPYRSSNGLYMAYCTEYDHAAFTLLMCKTPSTSIKIKGRKRQTPLIFKSGTPAHVADVVAASLNPKSSVCFFWYPTFQSKKGNKIKPIPVGYLDLAKILTAKLDH